MEYQVIQKNMGFLDLVWNYKFSLAGYIIGVSFLTFIGLYAIGGVPEELKVVDDSSASSAAVILATSTPSTTFATGSIVQTPAAQTQGELPVYISIAKIGVSATISNTNSTNDTTLDNLLLKGAVRYPGSGTLGQGNMFIFGHSTGYKIVNNKAYQTFDHLNQLKTGDIIRIRSIDREYDYSVTSVKMVDSSDAFVNIGTSKNMLTLSTCNVFGEKQQRYVVEANFIGSNPITSAN